MWTWPGAGVDEERGRRLVPLQDLLDAVQVDRQHLGRHADVLDEGHRLGRAAQAVQAGQGHLAQTARGARSSASLTATTGLRRQPVGAVQAVDQVRRRPSRRRPGCRPRTRPAAPPRRRRGPAAATSASLPRARRQQPAVDQLAGRRLARQGRCAARRAASRLAKPSSTRPGPPAAAWCAASPR